jgi:hypothetical protein
MDEPADTDALAAAQLLNRSLWLKVSNAREKSQRFVHYTSAATAISILRNKEIWLRRTTAMNDYREVEHGLDAIVTIYGDREVGEPLKAAVDSIDLTVRPMFEMIFRDNLPKFRNSCYVMCLSEHDPREDNIGRLSMWRAYGQNNGVALVLSGTPLVGPGADVLKAYSSPVEYHDGDDIKDRLKQVTHDLAENRELFKRVSPLWLANLLFLSFRNLCLSTKHPGFAEEKEWRIIYLPQIEKSQYIREEVEVINGAPQIVCKLKLQNMPEVGINAEIPHLISRIILGPMQFPFEAFHAFASVLRDAGVENPEARIVSSHIPLRL